MFSNMIYSCPQLYIYVFFSNTITIIYILYMNIRNKNISTDYTLGFISFYTVAFNYHYI